MTAKIAVLVSGGGTNLQALIDAQQRSELGGGEITAVISSKEGAYALERARKAGIPGYVLPRKSFDSNRAMTLALVEKLKALDIDLVVLAGCMVIFTEELVQAYPNAIMNVHPALIPSFCGQGFYKEWVIFPVGRTVFGGQDELPPPEAVRMVVQGGQRTIAKAEKPGVDVGMRRRPHHRPEGRPRSPRRYPRDASKTHYGAGRMEAAAGSRAPVL